MDIVVLALWVTAIPALCCFAGGMLGSFYDPSDRVSSAVQHFAAGIVFAAVAVELLPMLGHECAPIAVAGGFLLGVFVMLLIKFYPGSDVKEAGPSTSISAVITAVGIDIFIDGLLIGIALLAGHRGGILIAIALAVEIFFLGLSTAMTMTDHQFSFNKKVFTFIGLMLLIPIGGMAGAVLLSYLPAAFRPFTLAFGVAALLYLVTEELLVDAHSKPDAPWLTACFFIGFLAILLLESGHS